MKRPLCACGNLCKPHVKSPRTGEMRYHSKCSQCLKKRNKHGKSADAYKAHKKNYCEVCGFVPEHPCQLDVDHKDGNHLNNDPSNFQTLCANYHRLKTFRQQDHMRRNTR